MSFPVAISHNHFSSNSLLLGFIKVLVPAFENLIKLKLYVKTNILVMKSTVMEIPT